MSFPALSSAWLAYGVPAALAYGFYLRRRARHAAHHRVRLDEAAAEGLLEPPSLHPVIDPSRCIGSSSCVKACPEHALGVIDGKATLVNGAACIGHGACRAACPVEAITLVFGTERRGVEIPVVTPEFETNVPGIYIAGELGGMGLISKAAEQGRQAIEAIGRRARQNGTAADYDVVIVGGGPAGLGAGLAAIAARLRYRLIEQETNLGGAIFHYPRNKIAMTSPLALPLVGRIKLARISKEKLLEFWHGVIRRTGLSIQFNERMDGIDALERGFAVRTTAGTHRAHTVLLAIGRRGTPRKLDVPGEERAKVVYRLVDPVQYARQRVLVVGGGDSALEAAIALAEQPGTRVTLSYRGDAFNRVKASNRARLAQLDGTRPLTVALQSQVTAIGERHVVLESGGARRRLRNDAVIVCAGGVLPTPLLREVGIRFETRHGEA
jgi:thioredoxin reductase (NADPH)